MANSKSFPKPLPHNRNLAKKSASPRCHTFYGKNPPPNRCTRAKAPFWAQVFFRQTPMLRWIVSLFCCLGRENLASFHLTTKMRYDSAFTKTQRDEWFSQIWAFKGTRQTASELERRTAAYPEEIADRLIRMFSVKGETVA